MLTSTSSAAERLLRLGEQPLDVGRLGDVALHGDGLAALAGDLGDDAVRAFLAGGVVHDDRRALGAQRPGDAGADALRCAGDDGDLTLQLAHVLAPVYVVNRCPGPGRSNWYYSS